MKKGIVHFKSYSGKRAICGVRTHMRTAPRSVKATGATKRVRVTTTPNVTCKVCLRAAVAIVRGES